MTIATVGKQCVLNILSVCLYSCLSYAAWKLHFSFLLSYSDLLSILIVDVEGCFSTWSHSVTHTHTSTHAHKRAHTHTHTHTHTNLARLLWTTEQSLSKNTNIDDRQIAMPLEEFEPGILAIERPQTYDIRSRGHRDRLRFFLRGIMSSGSALIFHLIS